MGENRMLKREQSVFMWIQFFCVLFISVSSVFPPIRLLGNNAVLCLIFMLLWIFIVFLRNFNFFMILPVHRLVIFLFVIYTFLVPYLLGNSSIGNRYLNISIIFFFYLAYQFNKLNKEQNINNRIIVITLCFALVTTIKTLLGLFQNPYLSRSIKSSGEYTTNIMRQGIGGYELVYFIVVLNIVCFYFLINRVDFMTKKAKLVLVVLVILFTSTILFSNYFTATILLFASFVFLVIFKFCKTIKLGSLIFMMFTIIVLPFSKVMMIKTIEVIIPLFNDGKTLNRLLSMHYELSNNISLTVYEGREGTIVESFTAFKDNIFLGLITNKMETDNNGFLLGFGQHSMIMDTFALFGIIIGLVYLYLIVQPFFVMIKSKRFLFDLIFLVGTVFVILNFMNNISPSIGFGVFFVLPVLVDYISEMKDKRGKYYYG